MADAEDCINLFPERIEVPGGTARMALLPTPGVEALHDTTRATGRAHIFTQGREFVVNETLFFEVSEDAGLDVTFIGFVAMDSNPATISSNGDGGGQLFITSGGNGYLYTLASGAFAQIAALNGKATMGDQLDGYFLALDAATGTMYSSELLDGATWTTGVMFAQRNQAPDPWESMKVKGRYIYLWGAETGEVWYDAGASPFPFQPHPSGVMLYGISAPFSAVICDDSLVWLGGSRQGRGFVLRATGFTPEVVSTYPVQYAISGYETISDAYGDSYNDAGHTFYVLGFATESVTWCFDLQMGMWHKRGTWNPDNNGFTVWRPRCHAFAFGEHRWLDGVSGHVYRMSSTLGTDAGSYPIRRVRRAPTLQQENERVPFTALELDVEPGLGLVTGQGTNPIVMMRISRDGGKTWGPERMRSSGKIGEYGKRLRWERLGSARRMVVEVSMSDPVPFRITNAYLELGQGYQQQRTA